MNKNPDLQIENENSLRLAEHDSLIIAPGHRLVATQVRFLGVNPIGMNIYRFEGEVLEKNDYDFMNTYNGREFVVHFSEKHVDPSNIGHLYREFFAANPR
jgi:hypothetical protein